MVRRPSPAISARLGEVLAESAAAAESGDAEAAWRSLEDGHVLSQPWARPHIRVHWAMLVLASREGSWGEMVGQLGRLLVAGPASVTGRYPTGNSGRAGVSAFAPPIDPAVAALPNDAEAGAEVGEGPRVLDASGVQRLYDRVAPVYDVVAAPYGWFGAGRLVSRAIAELRLGSGDTVVDLGTGTGRNLLALAEMVGPGGRVIGVDVSPKMLARARAKLEQGGLANVALVEVDMATFVPPAGTAAVLSTFAMEMAPDYEAIIGRLARQISPAGRIAVCGLRHPERWPEWVVRLGSAVNRPFGVSEAYRSHRPWEAVQAYTIDAIYDEALGGAAYLCAGTTPSTATQERLWTHCKSTSM